MMVKRRMVLVLGLVLLFSGMAGAGVMSPPDLEGLGLWFAADDLDGDGAVEGAAEGGLVEGKVAAWIDKSGETGHDAGQTVVGSRPGYVSGDPTYGSWIDFDGVDDFLNFDFTANPHTIFIVHKDEVQLGSWGGMFNLCYGGSSAANLRQPFLAIRDVTDKRLCLSYMDVNVVNRTFNIPFSDVWNVMAITKPAGETPVTLWRDGVQKGQTPAFIQDARDGTDYIGKGPNPWKGQIAEIIVYRRGLSSEEIDIVGYYLENKYNLDTTYTEGPVPVGKVEVTDGMTEVAERWQLPDTFSVQLLKQPAADVTVTATVDAAYTADIDLDGGDLVALTFTSSNWGTAQDVTVTVQQDAIEEGDEVIPVTFALASSDPEFTNAKGYIDDTAVTVLDDDGAGADVALVGAELLVSEQEELLATNQFTVVLTKTPTSDVTVYVSDSSDPNQVEFDSTELLFTPGNYNQAQAVTVSAIDDEEAETDPLAIMIDFVCSSSDSRYDGFEPESISGAVLDNDCGLGPFLAMDVNEDCVIDLIDVQMLAGRWLICSMPNVPGCINPASLLAPAEE